MGEEADGSGQKFPGVQSKGRADPAGQNDPMGHVFEHVAIDVAPVMLLYVPPGHGVGGAFVKGVQYEPFGHSKGTPVEQ